VGGGQGTSARPSVRLCYALHTRWNDNALNAGYRIWLAVDKVAGYEQIRRAVEGHTYNRIYEGAASKTVSKGFTRELFATQGHEYKGLTGDESTVRE